MYFFIFFKVRYGDKIYGKPDEEGKHISINLHVLQKFSSISHAALSQTHPPLHLFKFQKRARPYSHKTP